MNRFIWCVLIIVLPFSSSGQLGFGSTRRAGGNFSQHLINKQVENGTAIPANAGKKISRFNDVPNTVGRQFFSDSWLSGDSIIDNSGNLFSGSGLFFNYDMRSGTLIASPDKSNLTAVDREAIVAFTLSDDNGSEFLFSHVPEIQPIQYFLLLAKTSAGLLLYKRCSAEFKKADFRSDGISQQGSREDRYIDQSEYFLFDNNTKQHNPLTLKAKSIQSLPLLFPYKKSVDIYLREHKGKMTEQYLASMIQSLEK